MNKIKYSLYIIGLLVLSTTSVLAAAMEEMNYVGRVMFGFFGMAGFALFITYMSWKYKSNRKRSAPPKIANRAPVKRDMSVYYKKRVA